MQLRFEPVQVAALALATPVLALTLGGCTPAWQRPTYENCVREPRAWGEGSLRRGTITAAGFQEGSYQASPDELAVTITRSDCLDSVEVRGRGIEFRGGPYRPLWDSAFAFSHESNRLALAHYSAEDEAWVWLDGKRHGPYPGIGIGPRFSQDGTHVAWATLDGSDQVLWVDGREVRRGERLLDHPFFWVLNDGRVAAPVLRTDGKHQILIGNDYDSGPFEEHCSSWGFRVGTGHHWAYTIKRSGKWVTVVDGREVNVPGVPGSCDVVFSEGGRWGYVNLPAPGMPETWRGAVLDGKFLAVEASSATFEFVGELPIVRGTRKVAPNVEDWEQRTVALGVPTPATPPSEDAWEPQRTSISRQWARVQIGASVGPKFDRIKELAQGPDGSIRYVGLRHETPHIVVDNVIVPPGQVQKPGGAVIAQ